MSNNRSVANLVTQALSAAAVVLSLVFVGLEVRESARQTELNTQSLQISTYQDLIAQLGLVQLAMFEDPSLRRRLQDNSRISWANLSADQRAEFGSLAFLLLRYGDLAFYQYEIGMLTEERLNTALGPLRGLLFSRPAFCTWWISERQDSFTASYQELINSKLMEIQDCGDG